MNYKRLFVRARGHQDERTASSLHRGITQKEEVVLLSAHLRPLEGVKDESVHEVRRFYRRRPAESTACALPGTVRCIAWRSRALL